jgi:hypothetical protein
MFDNKDLLDLIAMAKTPQQKAQLLKVLADKEKADAKARFNLEKILSASQRNLVTSAAKRKVLVTSRRAGKSTALAAYLLVEAMKAPRTNHCYISLTKASAKRIIWQMLINFIDDYALPFEYNNHELSIKGTNGSCIYVDGAKDSSSVERLRGLSIDTAVVDELQSFTKSIATSLVEDILEPSVSGTYGNIILAGTPCPTAKSALAVAWRGEKPFASYVRFHWTTVDNPYLPLFVKGGCTPDQYLDMVRREKGYTESDPSYRREYLGQFVEDKNALVYAFSPERDLAPSLPEGHKWHYVISVDTGFNDADAITVGAFSYTHSIAYVVEGYSEAKQDLSSLMDKIKELNDKYKPILTIVDPGGGGLKFVAELNNRFGICAAPAEKYNPKIGGCALVSSAFRDETFKIIDNESTELLQCQLQNITFITKEDKWGNVRREVPDGKNVKGESGVLGDDLADSMLYLFKRLKNYYAVEVAKETPQEKTKRMLAEHMEKLLRQDKERARELANPSKLWF